MHQGRNFVLGNKKSCEIFERVFKNRGKILFISPTNKSLILDFFFPGKLSDYRSTLIQAKNRLLRSKKNLKDYNTMEVWENLFLFLKIEMFFSLMLVT